MKISEETFRLGASSATEGASLHSSLCERRFWGYISRSRLTAIDPLQSFEKGRVPVFCDPLLKVSFDVKSLAC